MAGSDEDEGVLATEDVEAVEWVEEALVVVASAEVAPDTTREDESALQSAISTAKEVTAIMYFIPDVFGLLTVTRQNLLYALRCTVSTRSNCC